MDLKTLDKLEFNKIKSLLADLTFFEGGYNLALDLIPSNDLATVNCKLDQTQEAMEIIRLVEPGFLSGLVLLYQPLNKARTSGVLTPAEIRGVGNILRAARLAANLINEDSYPHIHEAITDLFTDAQLEKKIDRSVNDDGELQDDASPKLKEIRGQINTIKMRIRDYLQDFIRSGNNQKMLQDALVTEREGRYVVPVKQEYRQDIKGIIHDESASGATVFIEPMAVVEQNNRIRLLQSEERREIERILRELSAVIAFYTDELENNLKLLSELDFIFARARLAYKLNAFRPEMNARGIIELSRACHPLLGESAVPIDVHLGKDFDILVITGPNTGGKTVALKTIGLLVLMAMSGMYIPARENSRVSVFNSIFADIGDEQSIEQSLSTFSSHMTNIISILKLADDHSLVLMDELGAGTDPTEGASLARVILEELRDKGARVVVTTHQSELKYFAYQNDRVENASVEFDPISLQPTYRLSIGTPGQSNAFEIASRLGLSPQMVSKARSLVPEREVEIGNMIREFKERSYYLDKAEREIAGLKAEILNTKMELQKQQESLEIERGEIISKAKYEADNYVRKVKNEANEALQELKDFIKDREQLPKWHEIEEKHQRLKEIKVTEWQKPARKKGKREFKPGDYVIINDIKQKGYIISGPNNQGEFLIQVGIMKLSVTADQLQSSDSPDEPKKERRNQSYFEKAQSISKEIDVRGKLAEEAIYVIDKYIDDACLVGIESINIIHGKGTGALRKAIQGYLQGHPSVQSYRDGQAGEGGFGVTVVHLR